MESVSRHCTLCDTHVQARDRFSLRLCLAKHFHDYHNMLLYSAFRHANGLTIGAGGVAYSHSGLTSD